MMDLYIGNLKCLDDIEQSRGCSGERPPNILERYRGLPQGYFTRSYIKFYLRRLTIAVASQRSHRDKIERWSY